MGIDRPFGVATGSATQLLPPGVTGASEGVAPDATGGVASVEGSGTGRWIRWGAASLAGLSAVGGVAPAAVVGAPALAALGAVVAVGAGGSDVVGEG